MVNKNLQNNNKNANQLKTYNMKNIKEMDILESNANVYKLIGNVQTKLTVPEAK